MDTAKRQKVASLPGREAHAIPSGFFVPDSDIHVRPDTDLTSFCGIPTVSFSPRLSWRFAPLARRLKLYGETVMKIASIAIKTSGYSGRRLSTSTITTTGLAGPQTEWEVNHSHRLKYILPGE